MQDISAPNIAMITSSDEQAHTQWYNMMWVLMHCVIVTAYHQQSDVDDHERWTMEIMNCKHYNQWDQMLISNLSHTPTCNHILCDTYTHTHTHTYAYIHTHTYIRICTHIHTHTYTDKMYKWNRSQLYMQVCMYVAICVWNLISSFEIIFN